MYDKLYTYFCHILHTTYFVRYTKFYILRMNIPYMYYIPYIIYTYIYIFVNLLICYYIPRIILYASRGGASFHRDSYKPLEPREGEPRLPNKPEKGATAQGRGAKTSQ